MSDQRINLGELLERLKWLHIHSRLSNSDYPAVMALVEAVEAAQAFVDAPWHISGEREELESKLADALDRFDFGDAA